MVRYFCLFLLVALSLNAGVYLTKPDDFNPKAEVVACCFLHYQDTILLLHRQDHKHEGNLWGIPGGKLNKNEPVPDALIREVFEETGYRMEKEKLQHMGMLYIQVPNFDFEYHMYKYTDKIKNPGEVKINFREHKGFTWVTPEDALKMNLMTDEDICFMITFGLNKN